MIMCSEGLRACGSQLENTGVSTFPLDWPTCPLRPGRTWGNLELRYFEQVTSLLWTQLTQLEPGRTLEGGQLESGNCVTLGK